MIRIRSGLIILVTFLLIPAVVFSSHLAFDSTKTGMRPYAGIGILILPLHSLAVDDHFGRMILYGEPAMTRLDHVDLARAPRYEWIIAMNPETLPLIVVARRGQWFKVVYDDAGREGWIRDWQSLFFRTWEDLLWGQSVYPLPGLQQRYYRLRESPGGEWSSGVAPRQILRVIGMEDDWLRVENEQRSQGWLRWRDEDGRLLIGMERETALREPDAPVSPSPTKPLTR